MSKEKPEVGEDKADLKVKLKKPSLIKKDKGPIKVDLTKKEEEKIDAIQIGEAKEVPVEESPRDSKEVVEEVRVESNKDVDKKNEEVVSPISEVTEEELDTNETTFKAEAPQEKLPENIEKLVSFMKETGGNMEDYVRLNTDYTSVDPNSLLTEYYKSTKPHLDKDEIDFLIEDKFGVEEDIDDEKTIKKKQLATKEELAKARSFFEDTKAKYYDEIKLRPGVTQDQQKANDFFNRHNKEQKIAKQRHESFINKTKTIFNDFKGFDFEVGGKKFKYNVNNPSEVANRQSDLNTFVKKFLNKEGEVVDTVNYHKAIYAAENVDTIANHFYEQGKSDATKNIMAQSKNISAEPRASAAGDVFVNGMRVKAISGADSSKLKIKKINKTT